MPSTIKTAPSTAIWLIPVILMIGLSGCSVSMISPYDERTAARIEQFTADINNLLLMMEEQDAEKPDCLYTNHADSYRNLRVQLQTMALYENTKPKNKQTQDQVKQLQDRLKLLIDDHKRICQPAVAIGITRSQINGMLENMLLLESKKKSPNNK